MTIRFCFLVLSFSVLLNVPLNAFLDDGDSDKFIFTKDSSRAGNPIIKIRTTKGRPIIDEQAVESLAKNKELIELDLSYARLVRPGVLKNLKGLKQLETIKLRGSNISDEDLVFLKDSTKVRWVNLFANSNISDTGIKHLAHLSRRRAPSGR